MICLKDLSKSERKQVVDEEREKDPNSTISDFSEKFDMSMSTVYSILKQSQEDLEEVSKQMDYEDRKISEYEKAKQQIQSLDIWELIKRELSNYIDTQIAELKKTDDDRIKCPECNEYFDNEHGVKTHAYKKHNDLSEEVVDLVSNSDKLYFGCKDIADRLDVSRRHVNEIINKGFEFTDKIKKTKIKRKWVVTRSSVDWLDVKAKMKEGISGEEVLSLKLYDLVTQYNSSHAYLSYRERYEQYVNLHSRIQEETELSKTEIYSLFNITGSAQYQMLKIEDYCECLQQAIDYAAPGTIYQYRSDSCKVHQIWLDRLKNHPGLKRNLDLLRKEAGEEKDVENLDPVSSRNKIESEILNFILGEEKADYEVILNEFAYYIRNDIDRALGKLMKDKLIVSHLYGEGIDGCYYTGVSDEPDVDNPTTSVSKTNGKMVNPVFKAIEQHEAIDLEDLVSELNLPVPDISNQVEKLLEEDIIEKHHSPILDNFYFTLKGAEV